MKNNLEFDINIKKNILYVDDDVAMTKTVEFVLKHCGYEVTVATRSKEALRLVKALPDKFDLMMTDMRMEEMNGIELSKMIRKIAPDIPIILCTGLLSVCHQDIMDAGISETIRKPFTISEIKDIVGRFIDCS